MEKLSGILPSNARIKSVDMKSSHAARPGTPAFGRMQGRTASEDRVSFGDLQGMQQNLATGYNPKEARNAKIAEDMARNFFETRLQPNTTVDAPQEIEEEVLTAVPKTAVAQLEQFEAQAPLTATGETLNLYA